MAGSPPMKLASVGLGGYAWAMCEIFLRQSAIENPPIQLVAVCEPDLVLHAARAEKVRAAGVKVFADYDQLLTETFDAVWLPIPIDLHRSFTEKAAAAGKAVICEKPAAGCIDDLDAMIAARDKFGVKAAIAFQDIYDTTTVAIKNKLVSGAIGKIRSVTLHACWPRGDKYYNRSTWAGRNKRNGVWVMDSPANNALAHFINKALFFLGPTEREMAQPISVEAELYRANPIETFDTCSLRITVAGQIPLLVQFTHACETLVNPHMEFVGERGRLRYDAFDKVTIESSGAAETISVKNPIREEMIAKLSRWVRGQGDDLVVSLEMARPHLEVVSGASEAAAVTVIGEQHVHSVKKDDGETLRTLPNIDKAFAHCGQTGQMLHESGQVAWSSPSGTKSLIDYKTFAGPKI